MQPEDIADEFAKLRYHVKLLGEAIDRREHSVTAMILDFDWSEEDVERAENIFEKYDNLAESGASIDNFERELCEAFNINYQQMKQIVLGFYRNGHFIDVCRAYAKMHPVAEFSEIP
ncbi:MAG: hypothetical protein AB7I37_19580 [Pirellulales bacterium]